MHMTNKNWISASAMLTVVGDFACPVNQSLFTRGMETAEKGEYLSVFSFVTFMFNECSETIFRRQ